MKVIVLFALLALVSGCAATTTSPWAKPQNLAHTAQLRCPGTSTPVCRLSVQPGQEPAEECECVVLPYYLLGAPVHQPVRRRRN